jgi:2-hydroxychromene-2-carboxylate isomerase
MDRRSMVRVTAVQKIDFWFDPSCPFTWRTNRWLVEVAGQHDLDVQWHVMSLAILNEGKESPPQLRERIEQGRVTTRVMQAVREAHGNDALGRFYTALGTRVHEQDGELGPGVYREALTAAGLPVELAVAGDDDTYQAAVAASHAEGQARVGQEAGSPVMAVDGGPGFFGPIVVPAPTGDEASRLFDAVVLLSGIPSFSELKRARQNA